MKIATFKPTLLQRILGKHYKWWYLYILRIRSRTSSFFDSVIFVIGHMITVLGTILIWWVANDKVVDYEFQSKLTYFIVGDIFLASVYQFSSFYGFQIIKGSHVTDLLLPVSFFKNIFFKWYGDAALQNLTKIVYLSCAIVLFSPNLIYKSPVQILLLVCFAPITLLIHYFGEIMVAMTGFFNKTINGIILNYAYLHSIFAGKLFPLNLLIEDFTINLFNPFAFTFYHPMQIYLGKYDTTQTLLVFAGGVVWCVLLYIAAKWLFKLGLKRNEAVGL
jgi:ABC-type uncharacterized transport system permease subunit